MNQVDKRLALFRQEQDQFVRDQIYDGIHDKVSLKLFNNEIDQMVSMKEFKEHVEMIETYIANFNRIESVILPGYRKEVEIKHDKLAQELKQLSNYTHEHLKHEKHHHSHHNDHNTDQSSIHPELIEHIPNIQEQNLILNDIASLKDIKHESINKVESNKDIKLAQENVVKDVKIESVEQVLTHPSLKSYKVKIDNSYTKSDYKNEDNISSKYNQSNDEDEGDDSNIDISHISDNDDHEDTKEVVNQKQDKQSQPLAQKDIQQMKIKLNYHETTLRSIEERLSRLIRQSPKANPMKSNTHKSEKKRDEEYNQMSNKIEKVMNQQASIVKRLNTIEGNEGTKMSEFSQMKKKTKTLVKEVNEKFTEITNLSQTCDGISKRIFFNEQNINRIEHQINLIKCQKEGNLHNIKEDIIKLFDENFKISKNYKEFDEKIEIAIQELVYQIETLKTELTQAKGPLVDKISRIGKENESIMRELKRTQSANREMLSEYKSVITNCSKSKEKEYKTQSTDKYKQNINRESHCSLSPDKYQNLCLTRFAHDQSQHDPTIYKPNDNSIIMTVTPNLLIPKSSSSKEMTLSKERASTSHNTTESVISKIKLGVSIRSKHNEIMPRFISTNSKNRKSLDNQKLKRNNAQADVNNNNQKLFTLFK